MFGRKKPTPQQLDKAKRLENEFVHGLKQLDDYIRYAIDLVKHIDFSSYSYGDGGHKDELEKTYRIDLKNGHYYFSFDEARRYFLDLVDQTEDIERVKNLVTLYQYLKSAQYYSNKLNAILGELLEIKVRSHGIGTPEMVAQEIKNIRSK
ncbi:hypothetical protein [Vibrio cyclitrophicus]|uniref:hypothetical protein n=1 Tax=Vibrio cyclitrophicus TaxID=47951 RepID=UPI0011B50154|nr:hypothetical protein [Vibrio cyclitrophicus]